MGTSEDRTEIKADTVKKEAMEWMLDNLHYYCPVDSVGREKLAEFADIMEEREWREAVGAYRAIAEDFCNDIGLFMYGSRNGEKIVSRHTDAYLVSDVLDISDFCFPVGFCREQKDVNNEKINLNQRSQKFKNKTNKIDSYNIKNEIENEKIHCLEVELLVLAIIGGIFKFLEGKGAVVLSVLVLVAYASLVLFLQKIMGVLYIRQKEEYWHWHEESVPVSQAGLRSGNRIITQKVPEDLHNELSDWSERTNKRPFRRKPFIPEPVWRARKYLRLIATFALLMLLMGLKKTERPMHLEETQLVSGIDNTERMEPILGTKGVRVTKKTPGIKDVVNCFALVGLIFPDSDCRMLKREEIEALSKRSDMDYQTALGYARNEIYARMGYPFSKEGGKYSEHYNKYLWYAKTIKKEITDDMFNEYERANIDLILKIERELEIIGYQPGD